MTLCPIKKIIFQLKIREIQVWWLTSLIPALRKLRKEDEEFEASLGYTLMQLASKQTNKQQ
jgi:hypothetical protein